MKLSKLETLSDEELNKLYTEEKRTGDSMFLISIRAEMRRRLTISKEFVIKRVTFDGREVPTLGLYKSRVEANRVAKALSDVYSSNIYVVRETSE